MKTGVACLILAYMLSQFYRVFLAVLSPVLQADLGATAQDLSLASGLWFLAFAAMQFPVGAALDRLGPRRTCGILLGLGAGSGAALFAVATGPAMILAAMVLIGIGCSPVLMAAYVIIAKAWPPAAFASLAGLVLGLGSLGNVLGSVPLASAVAAWGWRGTMAGMAGLTVVAALVVILVVRDPPPPEAPAPKGSVLDVLKIRALWPIFVVMAVSYSPAASLRGLWLGPYGAQVQGLDLAGIGWLSLAMGVAMICGTLAYGPLDRWLGRRKALILGGNLVAAAALAGLALAPGQGLGQAVALLVMVGLFGAAFPVVVAHARSFVPAHLTGRGVAMVNLFSIAGTGGLQVLTGRIHAAASGGDPAWPFTLVFGSIALLIAAGCAVYLFAQDRSD